MGREKLPKYYKNIREKRSTCINEDEIDIETFKKRLDLCKREEKNGSNGHYLQCNKTWIPKISHVLFRWSRYDGATWWLGKNKNKMFFKRKYFVLL